MAWRAITAGPCHPTRSEPSLLEVVAPYDVASVIRRALLPGPEAEEEAGKRFRVQYRDPSDPSTYIRVKNDADVEEMMEEWVGLSGQCLPLHSPHVRP